MTIEVNWLEQAQAALARWNAANKRGDLETAAAAMQEYDYASGHMAGTAIHGETYYDEPQGSACQED